MRIRFDEKKKQQNKTKQQQQQQKTNTTIWNYGVQQIKNAELKDSVSLISRSNKWQKMCQNSIVWWCKGLKTERATVRSKLMILRKSLNRQKGCVTNSSSTKLCSNSQINAFLAFQYSIKHTAFDTYHEQPILGNHREPVMFVWWNCILFLPSFGLSNKQWHTRLRLVCHFFVLTTFDVICDVLVNRRTAK